ncbi:MAG: peptidylprolyl isomerase [Gemmatimonadota bacterium]
MRRIAPRWTLALAATLTACGGAAERPRSESSPDGEEAVRTDQETAEPNPAHGGEGVDLLLDPAAPAMNETAPDEFQVRFETSEGEFVVAVHRAWSPHGVDRFFNLVQGGFYDGVRFFRVLPGFVAQFGISGDPRRSAAWRSATIPDDPVAHGNVRGTLSFATAGPGTRTTQVFINFGDNSRLDGSGFSPFGEVVEGMEVVDRLYGGYGEGAPSGRGPNQARIQSEGNAYLESEFPELDFVRRAYVVERP